MSEATFAELFREVRCDAFASIDPERVEKRPEYIEDIFRLWMIYPAEDLSLDDLVYCLLVAAEDPFVTYVWLQYSKASKSDWSQVVANIHEILAQLNDYDYGSRQMIVSLDKKGTGFLMLELDGRTEKDITLEAIISASASGVYH